MAMTSAQKQRRHRERNAGDLPTPALDVTTLRRARVEGSMVFHLIGTSGSLCGTLPDRPEVSIDISRHRICLACAAQTAIQSGLIASLIEAE